DCLPLLAQARVHRIRPVDEILQRHLRETLGEIFAERLELGLRIGVGGQQRRHRARDKSDRDDNVAQHFNPPRPFGLIESYWILASSESDAPLLSTQLTLMSSPALPPLKLNFRYGSFDTAGPHSAVNTVLPPCSNCTISM